MSKVGPGHPPKSTRFPKGVSGNPAGRPRKERPADPNSAFDVVVDKKLTINAERHVPRGHDRGGALAQDISKRDRRR